MPSMGPARYNLIKLAQRRVHGYPLATIVYYGPTNQLATKVAVGIMEDEDELREMKKWFTETEDIRYQENICLEIKEYIESHQVQSVVMTEGILGCPHESGIDYPEGAICPLCSYWANRDRWEGQKLY